MNQLSLVMGNFANMTLGPKDRPILLTTEDLKERIVREACGKGFSSVLRL
ncbi:MAG: hypothetical protein HQL32_01415 [Planctomycetes bacterium]|nr:hypothetical protein [Planctomycetota bacterium]